MVIIDSWVLEAREVSLRKGASLDERFMAEALRLARRGEGWVSPNPMVGAVLVRDGELVARGYHRRFGGPHAEVEALERFAGHARDATLYVTLEPCCHHGKTPPCTERILGQGVRKVVVGITDPNPQVAGRGIQRLRDGGVEVRVGCLEDECRVLNRTFFHWMEHGRPWVTLKWAQSLDGRIATSTGHSQWISSEASRRIAHRLRATHDAVLVGIETVLRDDPQLTVRHVRGRDPLRVVLDSRLRVPLHARVLERSSSDHGVWVATRGSGSLTKVSALEASGIRVVQCPRGPDNGVDLAYLLGELGRSGISSLLVEGGGTVHTAFLRSGTARRLVCFVGPMLLGKGVDAVGALGISSVHEALRFASWRVRRVGGDMVVDALLAPRPGASAEATSR